MIYEPVCLPICVTILVPSSVGVQVGQPVRQGQPVGVSGLPIVDIVTDLTGVGISSPIGAPVNVGVGQPVSVGDVIPSVRGVDVRDLIPERETIRNVEQGLESVRPAVQPGRAPIQGALEWQKGQQAIRGGSRPIRVGVGVRF